MNKTLIAIAIIFSIGLIGAFALFLQYNRYDLSDAGGGTVYKIDRKTGRTWMVVANKEVDVLPESQESSKEEAKTPAMDLGKAAFHVDYFIKSTLVDRVKKSKALSPDVTVEAFIGSQISALNRPLDLRGWDAVEKGPALWLVSYTYDLGQGAQGYYFEVNTQNGEVRSASADAKLQEKYALGCENFLCRPRPAEEAKKQPSPAANGKK